MHNTLNGELTRTGRYYPAHKLSALAVLHDTSQTTAPYAFSTIPFARATWDFNFSGLRDAVLKIDDEPVSIRVICVLKDAIHYPVPDRLLPWVDVVPIYEIDAISLNAAMIDYTGFHPGLDFGWFSDGGNHSIRIHIPRRTTCVTGRHFTTNLEQPRYIVDAFDNSNLRFDDDTHIMHPDLLKENDLVVIDCHLHLRADPLVGTPLFSLYAQDIRLVHLTSSVMPH